MKTKPLVLLLLFSILPLFYMSYSKDSNDSVELKEFRYDDLPDADIPEWLLFETDDEALKDYFTDRLTLKKDGSDVCSDADSLEECDEKEFNNCVMLSNRVYDKAERSSLMKRYKFKKDSILNPGQIRAYTLVSKSEIVESNVDEYSVNIHIFDNIIADTNSFSDSIYYNIND